MIKEKLQLFFGIEDKDYVNGITEVTADLEVLKLLATHNLLDFSYSYQDGPTIQEFYDFLEQHFDKDIKLNLFIINPNRSDFRIGVNRIYASNKYSDLNELDNKLFYVEYFTLAQKGNSHFFENKNYFGYAWFD